MIRKFISRVLKLGNDKKPAGKREAAIIPRSSHGISRDQISPGSRRVCDTLQAEGYKAYVVGGAVRDLLAGAKPKDFDVATDATPEQAKRCFRRSRIIGRRFQIVHAYMGQEIIEITTFRGALGDDAKTDAHGRVLHDNVFGSMAEDAARRDFTVNALYFDPASEQILDYHHGVADLKQKTLRMIGEPKVRYREDPVRMLRAVRLAAKLGLSIDPEARHPIRELASLLENVPAARLFDEMLKLLTSGHAVKCLQQLRAEGLHHGVLPLLDVILDQPLGEKFVMLSLADTDERIRRGKTSSPSFLFATLLWHEVLSVWERIKNGGESPIPALHQAMEEVLNVQGEKLAITRRIATDIKEIWALQPRFEQRSGKRPYGVLEHPRFRAAYDFLCLRAEAGELDQELAQWWTDFQAAEGETRAQMLLPDQGGARKKRRRRKKPGQGAGEGPANAAA
ncbi:polynucleotide adenylyltransferase PcnB [Azovibrio restrictus]|uniref:polynucleotide adenylyltransferase PcnB n=1 Tax=Azovibrio restrictus TaxID=146938 RepID=UPI0026F2F252|nr:polynucleotide adenylyltransferase PcnB [Azovibrio restrictus]MDD3483252.1 polynucleotide adenylyltransferase PcnB [Azovibrio restrictus]